MEGFLEETRTFFELLCFLYPYSICWCYVARSRQPPRGGCGLPYIDELSLMSNETLSYDIPVFLCVQFFEICAGRKVGVRT